MLDHVILAKGDPTSGTLLRFGFLEGTNLEFQLSMGVPTADEIPADVFYEQSPDATRATKVGDIAQVAGHQLVVNGKVRALLEGRTPPPPVEFLPVGLKGPKVKKAEPYFVVNLLRLVACVDREKTEYTPHSMNKKKMLDVSNLTLVPGRIPSDADLFRLEEIPKLILVRRDLAEALVAAKVTGFRLVEASGWSDD